MISQTIFRQSIVFSVYDRFKGVNQFEHQQIYKFSNRIKSFEKVIKVITIKLYQVAPLPHHPEVIAVLYSNNNVQCTHLISKCMFHPLLSSFAIFNLFTHLVKALEL